MELRRASSLTLRIHRPEILLVIIVVAIASLVLVGAWAYVAGSALSEACWLEVFPPAGAADPSRDCVETHESFKGIQDSLGLFIAPITMLLPWIVGLVLGISVVGREVEAGTAGLAWSLTGERLRWLAMRFVPMLALTFVLLLVVAALSRNLWDTAYPWSPLGPGRLPALSALGVEGPTIVAGGIAALGLGLLLGAIVGRTMPAFSVGLILSMALALAFGPGLQSEVADQVAEWGPREYGSLPATILIDLESGFRDGDGPILDHVDAEALALERCPECYDDDIDWVSENLELWARMASTDTYPVFEVAHTGAGLGVGALCILLTLPIVSRRRPHA